jgi:NAD(P)-dependent dehydrogenase (short-subunit alcohol dehydrogenase family)
VNAGSADACRVAVVTGASSGLGLALADLLFARGWSVLGMATRLENAERSGEAGNRCRTRRVDLADAAAARRCIADFAGDCGRLDALVNNAAVQYLGTVEELSSRQWRTSLDVNLSAPFELAGESIPHMRRSGGGVILNVSSIHASATGPGRAAYAATKAGLVGLTRALAVDHGRDNIRAIALSPGPFATEKLAEGITNLYPDLPRGEAARRYAQKLPLRRVGSPDEFAAFAASLLEDTSSFLTGCEIVFDGGLTARLAVGD